MARIDPNQAAAAATGNEIPAAGADPLGQPIIDMQTPSPSTGGPTQEAIDAAVGLGLNPNAMSPEEWEFVEVFNGGGLASIAPDGDPENPLIPAEDGSLAGTPVPLEVPTQQTTDAPSPAAGAETGRAGEAPDGGGNTGVPTAPSPQTAPESFETPGRPAFQIPNTIPPAPEPVAPAPPAAAQTVQLPDGSIVTLETYQMLLAAQQGQQPFAQQQPTPQYVAPPLNAPPAQLAQPQPQGFVPNAWSTTPGEYVDERAAMELAQLRSQFEAQQQALQQTQLQTAAMLEQSRANTAQSLETAVQETLVGYSQARGIPYERADELLQDAVRLGLVGVYSQHFPGDPRRAVAAAVENVYNNTPEFRTLEIQREVERTREANLEVEKKKAFAGQTTGTPGSAPRTAAPSGTVAERNAGMVAMIEADPAFQAQQAQRR